MELMNLNPEAKEIVPFNTLAVLTRLKNVSFVEKDGYALDKVMEISGTDPLLKTIKVVLTAKQQYDVTSYLWGKGKINVSSVIWYDGVQAFYAYSIDPEEQYKISTWIYAQKASEIKSKSDAALESLRTALSTIETE